MALSNDRILKFDQLKKGQMARVVGCQECSEELIRLQEMGLTEGAVFQVIKVAPFGDPVEINLRGYRLCLRKRENCAFLLEAAGEPEGSNGKE